MEQPFYPKTGLRDLLTQWSELPAPQGAELARDMFADLTRDQQKEVVLYLIDAHFDEVRDKFRGLFREYAELVWDMQRDEELRSRNLLAKSV